MSILFSLKLISNKMIMNTLKLYQLWDIVNWSESRWSCFLIKISHWFECFKFVDRYQSSIAIRKSWKCYVKENPKNNTQNGLYYQKITCIENHISFKNIQKTQDHRKITVYRELDMFQKPSEDQLSSNHIICRELHKLQKISETLEHRKISSV